MRSTFTLVLLCSCHLTLFAQDDYKPGPDSLPQLGVPKGEMLKDRFAAGDGSVFPGTEREYQVYLPAGFDKTQPAPFMVFQDGVIYQAPTVFDNLIAKKEIPPLIGIFIKPGIVPAANDTALPRFNRSYEYDSVSDTYARFLIDEFLPAVEQRHGIRLSTDPNDTAIAGNSSGGICAFMVAWHRPHRFRRVFTGVGTYVGIRGGDRLPVLVRKVEPKPIRVFLQSGEHDNDLYCGDWWMANQMMERSLTWAGYDVNHAWGTGGHNQKHATAVFPDAMRWLWRDWQTNKEIRANQRGDSKWRGYEVVEAKGWEKVPSGIKGFVWISSNKDGDLFVIGDEKSIWRVSPSGSVTKFCSANGKAWAVCAGPDDSVYVWSATEGQPHACEVWRHWANGRSARIYEAEKGWGLTVDNHGVAYLTGGPADSITAVHPGGTVRQIGPLPDSDNCELCLSPDQSLLFGRSWTGPAFSLSAKDGQRGSCFEKFFDLETEQKPADAQLSGLCVDTEGWLYVATSLGIQVCDQAGRVNFIIPTPGRPHDVCFGGRELSELFIACGDAIYKRPTKAHGYISGQMAPIKPKPPKL